MKLYDYFRSSAAYRVRIALNYKGVAYEPLPVNLRTGEEQSAAYRALNPQGLVPTLLTDAGAALGQSLAIIEYLDETQPTPPLLPSDPLGRARVRALAQVVACDIHPLNNTRVLSYLTGPLGLSEETKLTWYRHWVAEGLAALEALLASAPATGRYCYGDTITLADVCLVPQVANARRFDCPLDAYPTVVRIDAACAELEPFQRARPERQGDAV